MKILFKNIVLAMICGSCLLVNPVFGANDASQAEKLPDMSTASNPIVLKGIKNITSIRYRQEDYIKDHYKGYEIRGMSYTMDDDRFIKVISIENEAKDKKRIYFDMTGVYKKLSSSKDKETREKVKKMRERHTPLDPNNPTEGSENPFSFG